MFIANEIIKIISSYLCPICCHIHPKCPDDHVWCVYCEAPIICCGVCKRTHYRDSDPSHCDEHIFWSYEEINVHTDGTIVLKHDGKTTHICEYCYKETYEKLIEQCWTCRYYFFEKDYLKCDRCEEVCCMKCDTTMVLYETSNFRAGLHKECFPVYHDIDMYYAYTNLFTT